MIGAVISLAGLAKACKTLLLLIRVSINAGTWIAKSVMSWQQEKLYAASGQR